GLPYGQHNLRTLSGEKYLFDIYTYLANTFKGNAVYVSSDSGKNFQLFAYDFPSEVTDLFSGSEYYFLSSWGSIWRFPKSGFFGVNNQITHRVSSSLACSPNPIFASTRIGFSISSHGEFLIEAFDIMGRSVARIASGEHDAGSYEAVWDTRTIPPGSYIIRLTAGGESIAKVVEVVR
ncbi:MAG: T9SS type A sorting domain-containing protein, partial [Candidatus Kapaibacterium sp.]